MEMCRCFSRFYWNSKWPPQINLNFFSKNLFGQFFFKFQYLIPSNMVMCKWFFKDATKFQNGRQRSTPNFFVGGKTLKLKVRNDSNFTITLLSHSPQYGDVQVIFSRFYWNSKWPPWINFIFFCGRKNWKIEISNNSHCTITMITHHLEMCMWYYWNLKWPPQIDFLKFLT